jgi:hypothetical protein
MSCLEKYSYIYGFVQTKNGLIEQEIHHIFVCWGREFPSRMTRKRQRFDMSDVTTHIISHTKNEDEDGGRAHE